MNTAAAWEASWAPSVRRHAVRGGAPKRTKSKQAARQAGRLFDRAFDLAKENFPDLWEALTEHGRESFVQEIVDAGFSEDRERGIEDVIDGWYRTLELRIGSGYEQAMMAAGKSPLELEETVHTIEDLKSLLKP